MSTHFYVIYFEMMSTTLILFLCCYFVIIRTAVVIQELGEEAKETSLYYRFLGTYREQVRRSAEYRYRNQLSLTGFRGNVKRVWYILLEYGKTRLVSHSFSLYCSCYHFAQILTIFRSRWPSSSGRQDFTLLSGSFLVPLVSPLVQSEIWAPAILSILLVRHGSALL